MMTGQKNITDTRFSDQLSPREWKLIELYINKMMDRGGKFHYDEIARRAVRFANVVIDAIDETPALWEEMERKEAEERAEQERMQIEDRAEEEKALAEEERRSKLSPMERYREGLSARYEELDNDAKKAIFNQFLQWAQTEGTNHGIDDLRKTMSTHNRYIFSNVSVSYADWLDFQERFEKMLTGLSLYEQTKYGVNAEYFMLDKESRIEVKKKVCAGDRRAWALGKDKTTILHNHILIPRTLWEEWKEEYSNKKYKK